MKKVLIICIIFILFIITALFSKNSENISTTANKPDDIFELVMIKDFNLSEYQRDNRYLPEIIYENANTSFPHPEVLFKIAEAVGKYTDFIPGSEEVESNTDYKRLQDVTNADDFFESYELDGGTPEPSDAYELDFDNDGLNELIYFYPGGTMGNEYFDIIQLDRLGAITAVNSGVHSRGIVMYQYQGDYFFLNHIYDYYDKEDLGVTIFAMTKDGTLWEGNVYREMIGAELVFSDIFDENVKPLAVNIETKFEEYILAYKEYQYSKFEKEYKPSQVIMEQINELAAAKVDTFYQLDMNNDGTDEVLAESIFYPGSAHLEYLYQLIVYDYKTNRAIDLSKKFATEDSYDYSQRIFPIQFKEKNYFLSMHGIGSSYIFKLQEIIGDTPSILACWFVTTTERVNVSEGEK